MPFLVPYSHNDDEVRFAIERIAGALHSKRALQLFSDILFRPDEAANVSQHTLRDIRQFNLREIREWGGASLQDNLQRLVRHEWRFGEAILLIAAFRNERTAQFLKGVAHRARPQDTLLLEEFAPPPNLAFVTDIAFAETGNHAALVRLQARMKQKKVAGRVSLCNALDFIENRVVLRLHPIFLSDTRVAKKRFMSAMSVDSGLHDHRFALIASMRRGCTILN